MYHGEKGVGKRYGSQSDLIFAAIPFREAEASIQLDPTFPVVPFADER